MPQQLFSFKIMTYNIHSCINVYGRESPADIVRAIARIDPDIVALQEVEAMGPLMYYRNQAEWIAEKLDMQARFYPLRKSRWGYFGTAILTRFPHYMVKNGLLPSRDANPTKEPRGAAWICLQTANGPIHIVNTHLGLRMRDRHSQVRRLLGRHWLGSISSEEPIILCGDFNAGPRSLEYRMLSARFKDVQVHARQKGYPKPTFFSLYPVLRIDHIFVSDHFMPLQITIPSDLSSRKASDHLPVCALMALSTEAAVPKIAAGRQ
ncbi:MAG: hypothetical protein VR64_01650 [Desulfatitalea sp. BRH_c12]|nr:MAG: hypothetical protein VR64_01650 [Desulfatitalea sp. BRH_c12]